MNDLCLMALSIGGILGFALGAGTGYHLRPKKKYQILHMDSEGTVKVDTGYKGCTRDKGFQEE